MNKKSVIWKTVENHVETFGKQPESVAWAPGRIEVLGNHTDYNEGTVLSAAINLGLCFCISRSDQPGIHVLAVDVNQTADFGITNIDKGPGADWANYIKGVFHFIQEQTEQTIDGLNCTFSGSIPMGAGLSSSAALEVAAAIAALAALDILNTAIDPKEIAQLCRKAEHLFAGTNCGLLDQFSSLFGREHGLIHSDFRTLEVSAIDLTADIEFLVVNPHVKHSLADSPYNERRERCEQATAQLNELLPHSVTALRDVSPKELEQHKEQIDPRAAKRAAHIVGEINRVETGVNLLRTSSLTAFGKLLYESHKSSIDHFENSCPELDVVVGAAREAGALGARLSGGGFGGSAIVMVHANDAQAIGEKIIALCQPRGIHPEILEITPSAGTHLV